MTIGLVVMGVVVSASTPIGLLSALMVLIGLGGPLVMPMTTALLLEHVPQPQAGTASGVFNTSRQGGGRGGQFVARRADCWRPKATTDKAVLSNTDKAVLSNTDKRSSNV